MRVSWCPLLRYMILNSKPPESSLCLQRRVKIAPRSCGGRSRSCQWMIRKVRGQRGHNDLGYGEPLIGWYCSPQGRWADVSVIPKLYKREKIYRENKTLKRFYSVYIKKIAAICTCSSFMPYQECHCGSLTPPPQNALMTYRLSQRYINWTNIWRALQDIERVESRGIHLYSVWIMIHRLSTCCD